MIIPTPEYDPLFANDGVPFREKMKAYIREEFSDILGADLALLKSDAGLEQLAALYVSRQSPYQDEKAA